MDRIEFRSRTTTAPFQNMSKPQATSAEYDLLRAAFNHIRCAFDLIESTIREYETEHGISDPRQHHRILEIARSTDGTAEQKAERIAEIMRSFNLLCRMDDIRNETMYLRDHFDEFLQSGVFRPSEIKTIRDEFYEILSALLVVDTEMDENEQL